MASNDIYYDNRTNDDRYLVVIEMNEDRVIFDTVNSRGESIGRTAFDTAVFRGAIRSGNIRKLKEEELAKRLLEGVRFGL